MKTHTIYTISDPNTCRVIYVGNSTNFKGRCYQHKSGALRGKHRCKKLGIHLKELYDKGITPVFEEVIVGLDLEQSLQAERELINTIGLDNLYNKNSNIERDRHLWDPETRKKISAANMGKVLSDETKSKLSEAALGHTCTDETKKKIREAVQGSKNGYAKLTEVDVIGIKNLFKDSVLTKNVFAKSICQRYNVTRTTIHDILSGRTWSHIHV